MIKKSLLLVALVVSLIQFCSGQEFFKTASLFYQSESDKSAGSLNIMQDLRVDTLISRYVIANKSLNGMWGYRIQIYRGGDRDAQDESSKVRAEFMIEFPDINSYPFFQKPNWFLVRAGDFRTKVEGTKLLFLIRRKFPHAYLVQDKINFPDLNKN